MILKIYRWQEGGKFLPSVCGLNVLEDVILGRSNLFITRHEFTSPRENESSKMADEMQ